jgi:phospholipase/carboxylesterase
LGAIVAGGMASFSCELGLEGGGRIRSDPGGDARKGRLTARPTPRATGRPPTGMQPLGVGERRDGLVYVPRGHSNKRPSPLALMLHGAGSHSGKGIEPFRRLADDVGLILVAPDSRGRTWDVILGGFGPDVVFIERALAAVFDRYAIDPERVAVEGFSDGASYALSLGITNGDLFTHVIAFSPGFAAPGRPLGHPHFFVSHGIQDGVLPIDDTSREIIPMLERAGYDVAYREFGGGHAHPPEVEEAGLDWFLKQQS